MKTMQKETIKKYQETLQEFVDFLTKSNGRITQNQTDEIIKKRQISNTILGDAVRINVIQRIATGYYKINVSKIEPLHARQILLNKQKYNKSRMTKKFLR